MQASALVRSINEPATLQMARRCRELRAQGKDIIDLSLGQPDHAPPAYALNAAHEALDGPWHGYSPVNGYLDVREAISRKFARDNDLSYSPEQIVISTGAKQSLINVILSLVGPGDEVIVPAPFWVTYTAQVGLAGAKAVIVPSTIGEDWKPSVERIAAAITPRTRLILYSSPCNPSGSVMDRNELQALADVVLQHKDLYVMSDEIYEHIVFKGSHVSIGSLPGMLDRTITVNGLSKAFALTGWRVGYIGAPLWVAQAANTVQGQFTSGTNSIAQRVTKACVEADPRTLDGVRADLLRRKQLIIEGIRNVPGWTCNDPEGAFYLLPDVSASIDGKRMKDASDLSTYLLEEAGVSVVAGDPFGAPNTLRLSYATSDELLVKAAERIATAIAQLDT